MEEHIFKTDTTVSNKKIFLKRIRVLLVLGILLTGVTMVASFWHINIGVQRDIWKAIGVVPFAKNVVWFLAMLLIFIGLIKLVLDKRPFSATLTWCIRIIGILFIAASVIIPRLRGYQSSGFEIFSYGDFVLCDGVFLLPGLLFIILGNIIRAGFDMQKEMDEIL